jgi:type II secretory pathway predicted ATPase ExeA
VGESGAGKSTLRHDLIDRVQREGLQILFIQPRVIDKKKLTARMICEAILGDLAPNERDAAVPRAAGAQGRARPHPRATRPATGTCS